MPGAREMAMKLGLGLHLRGSDDPAREDVRTARARHPFLLGASTHSAEEARAALRAGADYVLLSPIWPSPSKPDDARMPLGAEVFDALRGLPVLALGGLTPDRLALARSNGAWGGAAMGALFDAKQGALNVDRVRDGALVPWLQAANYSP
jgi:thiamine-phosphate pyrophosphorylase